MNVTEEIKISAIAKAGEFNIPVGRSEIQKVYQSNLDLFTCPGCYAVFDNQSCLYVGSSINTSRRFGSHFLRKENRRFWSCFGGQRYTAPEAPEGSRVIVFESIEFKMLERFLIIFFRPKFNYKMNGRKETKWKRR